MRDGEILRPVAEVAAAAWGTLEVSVAHVGQTVAHGYAKLRAVVEAMSPGVAAVYDVDNIDIVFADGDGPVGIHGRQRLLAAGAFTSTRTIDPSVPWPTVVEEAEELVVTVDSDGDQLGLYRFRELAGDRGVQVLHMPPDAADWLRQVLERHPGLVRTPDSNRTSTTHLEEPDAPNHADSVRTAMTKLTRLWVAEPELRLGQLIANLLAQINPDVEPNPDLYYVDDGTLVAAIEHAISRRG